MPYQWIDPELFLEYEGVAVYHCYDDGSMVSTYWYTTDITDCNVDAPELEGFQFDVRDLPDLGLGSDDPQNHSTIIQNAVREGLIAGDPAIKTDPPPLVVKIEVLGGVAYVVEQPPSMEVEIVDRDNMVDEPDPCSPDMTQMPHAETLMSWLDEGICEATDGCLTEPDGVCPHGCKSWLLELGLI